MTESVITEFTGSQRDSISRVYRYGVGGIQVQDSHDVTRRLYRFDPSSNTMTENDPAQPGKILRRFVFDNYGMLEEAFSFGQPPRTFRYEAGGRQIVMREGGDYGAVGKTFSFEENGIAETAFGRDGSVERAYVFEPGGGAITIRSGGWYGDIERRLVCERINASVFREPEAFLQFLMFTEKSQREIDAEIDEQVAKIRGGSAPLPGRAGLRTRVPGILRTMAGAPAGLLRHVLRTGPPRVLIIALPVPGPASRDAGRWFPRLRHRLYPGWGFFTAECLPGKPCGTRAEQRDPV